LSTTMIPLKSSDSITAFLRTQSNIIAYSRLIQMISLALYSQGAFKTHVPGTLRQVRSQALRVKSSSSKQVLGVTISKVAVAIKRALAKVLF
ncbi:hypothetical protein CI238_12271, partial [Colletotrichum incanum]